jgi:hypothetical protein
MISFWRAWLVPEMVPGCATYFDLGRKRSSGPLSS